MNAVCEDVEKLVGKELASANERFPQFHSPHEGWAVLREKYDELEEEVHQLDGEINCYLWGSVKRNTTADNVEAIRLRAIAAACEAIQVAAMARKYLDMLEREE
jgi:hypothetical protein